MYKYSHGGNAVYEKDGKNILDLSANINPLGMPINVEDAIVREIENCDRYPDSFSVELREKIAEFEGVDPDLIFCGNGASDIIFRLPVAVNAKKVMVMAPAFSDYERAANAFGAEISRYALSADDGFGIGSGFASAVNEEKPDLVFICNPNNPTGKLTETGLIKELLQRRQDMFVAVDECFLDFVDQADRYTAKVFLAQYPNLVVLKSFTKIFGMPGIRLGYAICADRKLVSSLYLHGADWPVSNLAQAAGIAALSDAAVYIKKTADFVSAERKLMEHNLSLLGYKVFEASANYIFLQNPYPFDLYEELDKKGIRIRACGNYHGLDESYYRIAVSTKVNNAKVLTTISEIK